MPSIVAGSVLTHFTEVQKRHHHHEEDAASCIEECGGEADGDEGVGVLADVGAVVTVRHH